MESGNRIQNSGLRKRQKLLSVVFLVVLPYFKSKLHAIYNKEREAALQASLWGNVNERFDEVDNLGDTGSSFTSTSGLDTDLSVRIRFRKRFNKIVPTCYPWLHAGSEGYGTVM